MIRISSVKRNIIIYIISCICIILFSVCILNYSRDKKVMKFSVDDATLILEDIAVHNYDSIFESWYMSRFKEIHNEYDVDVTLFVYEQTTSYNISDFPEKYKDEFTENSNWLKLGWHGIDENDPREAGYTAEELMASFSSTTDEIIRFAGKNTVSKELRLHYWYSCGDELLNLLQDNGVTGLYYPDTDVIGYDFTEDEDSSIRQSVDGFLYKKYNYWYIKYQVTDIRLDYIESNEELLTLLDARNSDNDLVVFTHAWKLTDSNVYFETLCKWARDNQYNMDWN